MVAYYALTAAGLSSFWSLTIGGALTGITSVVNTIRRRKHERIAESDGSAAHYPG